MFNDNQIELLTVAECAELLYTGKGTVYRLLRSGELKGFLLGKSWRSQRKACKIKLNVFFRLFIP